MEPAVTILMPVRDFHEEFLAKAVDSVFAQTEPDWRLLVVVEPAVRSHVAACLEDALTDRRVSLVDSEGRRLAGAINTGMRLAETPFTAILLGDDLWAPEAVAVLSDRIDRVPDIDFFHSARRVVDERGRPISSVYPAKESFELSDFAGVSPVKHLLCWRREKALAIGGLDESLVSIGVDDWDFPWTMAENGARFHAIQDCLYVYRDHREGYRLTTHQPRTALLRGTRRILRKHGVGVLQAHREANSRKSLHLRQCLYRSPLDRLVKERLGFDPRSGWREPYR